ncbi:MAG: succinylglutamate desuccinylase/aspartoacylase family protein [Planctomycetota bacterium]
MARLAITLVTCCLAIQTCFGDTAAGVLGEGKLWETPYFVIESQVPGPTVIVTGGIHGNEPAGAASAELIRKWPIVRGRMIVIPRVNPLALTANTRYIPQAARTLRDLNRNFPEQNGDEPRGEIAREVWEFVVSQNPDWLFDLHEGYEFNVSHQPPQGKAKSVGSSIIFDKNQGHQIMTQRMLAAVNGMVSDADRRFVLLTRGPKKTTLASATIRVLGRNAMILETTFKKQPLQLRTRQHREMMAVALAHLGMIDVAAIRNRIRVSLTKDDKQLTPAALTP